MPLETGSFINDLTATNPAGSDPAGQGDDHLRLIKATVQGTFPQMGAIFGQVRRQDTALSISSTWNTNHFIVSASATATVVLTLPPAASITTGFYVDITTIGTGTVNLAASGAGSINGAATLSIPQLNTARAYFVTGTGWLADVVPHGQGGIYNVSALNVSGAMSVSGATSLAALTVNGVATMSAAVHMKSTLSISGAVTMAGTLTISGAVAMLGISQMTGFSTFKDSVSISGAVAIGGVINAQAGQIAFPAVQNPSAGANVLDDYEEGTFTPAITFAVPGDLAVTYITQLGQYTKIGRMVHVNVNITTNTFTHTTASGNLLIGTLPFTPADQTPAALDFQGIVLATHHQACVTTVATSTSMLAVTQDVTGGASRVIVSTAHCASGGTLVLNFQVSYRV